MSSTVHCTFGVSFFHVFIAVAVIVVVCGRHGIAYRRTDGPSPAISVVVSAVTSVRRPMSLYHSEAGKQTLAIRSANLLHCLHCTYVVERRRRQTGRLTESVVSLDQRRTCLLTLRHRHSITTTTTSTTIT